MIKVMIVDDQELIRESLKIILSSKNDIKITSLASDGQDVLNKLEIDKPDVILMDIRMPIMDGVSCTRIIKEKYPEIKIIVLTTFDDDEYIYDAIKYGADGYLLKGVSLDELYNAINNVYNGGGSIHPNIASKAMKMFSNMAKNELENDINIKEIENISKNEWKIIDQIGKGLSNKEIAYELSFSEGTVRNYLSIILDKLQLRDRTHLAIWAVTNKQLVAKELKK